MSSDTRAVVPGEASETDSDDDGLAQGSVNTNSAKGVVVQGEASETDSDDDKVKPVTEKGAENLSIHGDIPTLKVEQGLLNIESPSSPDTVSVSSLSFTTREGLGAPKYDTLIHHKLRDKNAALLMNIHKAVGGSLNDVSKTVHMANQQMNKSQVVIQLWLTETLVHAYSPELIQGCLSTNQKLLQRPGSCESEVRCDKFNSVHTFYQYSSSTY